MSSASRNLQKYDNSPKVEKSNESSPSFQWCGYDWKSCMDGGRLIHPGFPYQWYDIEQLRILSDQSLELNVSYKSKKIHHWDGKDYNPILACGTMRSVQAFDFGTFSCYLKCPHGYNLWPSFWLTGAGNWPPELDGMEGWSGNNDYFKLFIAQFPYIQFSWRTTTNEHYNVVKSGDLVKDSIGSRNIPYCKQSKDPAENFIKYTVEWFPNSIKFYANDKLVRSVTGKECEYLYKNLKDPEKGYKMNVIFNVWAENPSIYDVRIISPMVIKNFEYKPYRV